MEPLWAPWRMEFIEGKKESGCVFCRVLNDSKDRDNLVIMRGTDAYVILNKYPYNNGHLMVVPNQHTNDFAALTQIQMTEMNAMAQRCVRILKNVLGAQGFNLGMNLGEAAGAGIKEHLHLHVVPRWVGDTNFMPVLSETKSMPQHLLASYDHLFEHFRRTS